MGGDDTSTPAASKKAITAFSLNGVEGTINKTENTIVVTMPSGTSVTALVATFTTTGASVKVDSTVQESGTTANDFTSPVFYTVTADDATTHVYTVTVIVAGKSITAFSLNGVVGTINETKKTIVVNMPSGTNVTALVATFTTTGASVEVGSTVQVSGTTANNFTSPVVYTVTAVDATTQDYTVTVTIGDVNQPATTISVSMSPNNPSTASSSITGSYTVTDVDGGSVIETEWYDNGVLRQTHATTLASGTDTLSGGFSLSHTITFQATADGVPSNIASATVTAPGSTTTYYSMNGTIHVGSYSGAVLAGATVSIAGQTYTTGSTGTFTIAAIPAGTYAFSVSKSGYNTYTNSAYYVGSDQTGLNFYLTPSSTSGDYTSPNIGTLKYVPAGSFLRDATATNISTVSAFRMSEYEITRDQFLAVMGVDPSDTYYSSGTSDPVQNVTWYDAVEFCNRLSIAEGLTPVYTIASRDPASGYPILYAGVTATWSNNGYRLPTEMEWMWAAMGATAGTTGYLKEFAGSTGSNAIGDYAWYSSNSSRTTHPVGSKLLNELGLHDMSGNVREWCWDWYEDRYPTGTLTNYRGATPSTNRVMRGGCWDGPAYIATVAIRNATNPFTQLNNIGFRIVRP